MATQVKNRPKKKISNRTVHKVRFNEFIKLAGRIANGGITLGHPEAIRIIKTCAYKQKGIEREDITDNEAAQLLKQI